LANEWRSDFNVSDVVAPAVEHKLTEEIEEKTSTTIGLHEMVRQLLESGKGDQTVTARSDII
jgi:hypothetical protein